MSEEINLSKMVIRFILVSLEAVLLWSFLRALPVVCAGNIAGIAASAVLMAVTVFFDKFKEIVAHLWKSGGGRALVILIAAVIAAGLVYCIVLSVFMARAIQEGDDKKPDAVIVLGCQIRGDRPSRMLRIRLDTAIDVLNENPEAVCIVSGGQGSDEDYTEAEIMKKYLIEKGISPERVIEEGGSATTMENMHNSKLILDDLSIDGNICFVSDGYHIYRAGLIARDCGLDAYGVPAPTEGRFITSYWVREWLSITYYFLKK